MVTPGPILIFLNIGRPDLTNNPSLIFYIPCIPKKRTGLQFIRYDLWANLDPKGESELVEF